MSNSFGEIFGVDSDLSSNVGDGLGGEGSVYLVSFWGILFDSEIEINFVISIIFGKVYSLKLSIKEKLVGSFICIFEDVS